MQSLGKRRPLRVLVERRCCMIGEEAKECEKSEKGLTASDKCYGRVNVNESAKSKARERRKRW